VAKLQVRRAVEVGPEILQILLEVPERERHGRDPTNSSPLRRAPLARIVHEAAAARVVGLLGNAAVGAWWLDPIVGLLIAGIAVKEELERAVHMESR
jgi:hypothetical protein